MEDDSLQKYIKTLKAARSDNDKFAALLLVRNKWEPNDSSLDISTGSEVAYHHCFLYL